MKRQVFILCVFIFGSAVGMQNRNLQRADILEDHWLKLIRRGITLSNVYREYVMGIEPRGAMTAEYPKGYEDLLKTVPSSEMSSSNTEAIREIKASCKIESAEWRRAMNADLWMSQALRSNCEAAFIAKHKSKTMPAPIELTEYQKNTLRGMR